MRRLRVLLAAVVLGGLVVVAGPVQPASAATCTFTSATATISYSQQATGYLYIGSVSSSHSGCTTVLVTARFQPTIELTGTGIPSTCTPVLSTCVLATGWILGSRTGVNVYAEFVGVGSNVVRRTGICPILGPAFGLHPTCSFNL